MAPLLQAIAVPLVNGETARVVVESVVGDFAVHLRIWGGRAVGPGYSVTHVVSGIAVWTVAHLPDAIRVAQWLDKAQIIPKQEEAAVAWRIRFKDPERSKLIQALTAIAPRYIHGP